MKLPVKGEPAPRGCPWAAIHWCRAGTGRLAVAGDRRSPGALDGTGAADAPPGRGAIGAPGRPWSRYDDARTAVVRDILRTVISALAAEAGRARLDILDAGGGTGGFAVPLAGLGHNVTVIDPSPDSLAAAERRAAEMNVPLSVVQGDVVDLAMVAGEASADLVLCHSVLEYVDSPADAMASIAQVLRPAGAVSVLAASSVAAVIHRALAGRFDDARRLLTGIGAGQPSGASAAAAVHPGRGRGPDRGGGPAGRPRPRGPGLRGPGARHVRGRRPRRRRRAAGAGAGGVGPPRLPRHRHPVPHRRIPVTAWPAATLAVTSSTPTWTPSTPASRSVTGPNS